MWGGDTRRRIFAYTRPTDMRKSLQGLLGLVQQVFAEDPYSGSLFVFVNRRGNYVKILAWDRTGFALYAKRLERGRFVFPSSSTAQEFSDQALRFLLDRIPLGGRHAIRQEGRVTRAKLSQASHAQLIDLVLDAQREREQERAQRQQLNGRLQEVEQQLRCFKKQLFGTRSERRLFDEADPAQLCLGEGLREPEQPAASPTTVRTHVRRHRPPRDVPDEKGLRFDDSVRVETIEIPNEELEDVPASEQELIAEKVTHRICQRPGSYFIKRILRKVVKRKDTGEITTAPVPYAVLEKSYADVSLLAGMLVDKLRYHLPLYRQHQRLQAAGIRVSRASLTSWVGQAGWLLEPIYDAQLDSILESRVLAMDETPIRAGRKSKGKMKTGFFWPLYGDRDEVAFPYAASRARRVIDELLGSFSGTLLSDGYEAYHRFAARQAEVTHALCWAHARRNFVDAEDVEPARAGRALDLISQLYQHEEAIRKKGLAGAAKLQARAEHSKPVAERFFRWLEDEFLASALLPTNPFTKAATYALKRQAGLEVFPGNPDVLVDVLQRIAIHPQARVAELTPRLWKEHLSATPLESWAD